MPKKVLDCIVVLVACFILSGCTENRQDPCDLLSAFDVKSIDADVEYSVWAGKDEGKRESEVCMYYAAEGVPKVMLFVWYDRDEDPESLVGNQGPGGDLEVVHLPGVDSRAVAAFSDSELKLLAVKSSGGVVGFRIRRPVSKDSPEMLEIAQLAQTALSRR